MDPKVARLKAHIEAPARVVAVSSYETLTVHQAGDEDQLEIVRPLDNVWRNNSLPIGILQEPLT